MIDIGLIILALVCAWGSGYLCGAARAVHHRTARRGGNRPGLEDPNDTA